MCVVKTIKNRTDGQSSETIKFFLLFHVTSNPFLFFSNYLTFFVTVAVGFGFFSFLNINFM